jgi:hypothetical protein
MVGVVTGMALQYRITSKGIQYPNSPSEGEPGKFECGVKRKSPNTPVALKIRMAI